MKYYVNVYEDGESYYSESSAAGADAETHIKENGDTATYIRTEIHIDGVVVDNDFFATEEAI